MPRRTSIRWTKNQKEKLRRAVQKFNAKITREIKKNPSAVDYLPQKVSVKDLKKDIGTSRDLNLYVKSVERVFRKGALNPVKNNEGVTTTKYQVDEARNKVRRLNIRRAYERKALGDTRGKGIDRAVEDLALSPKPFNFKKMNKREWDAFQRNVWKMSRETYINERDTLYKENYNKALIENMGPYGEELVDLLEDVDSDIIAQARLENPNLNIDFIYDPIEQNEKNEIIYQDWIEYLTDNDLLS